MRLNDLKISTRLIFGFGESAAAAESLKGQAQQLVSAVAVFKLAHNASAQRRPPSTPAHAPQPTAVERRRPDRAKNVARPKFGAKAAASPNAAAAAPPETGTDDEWVGF